MSKFYDLSGREKKLITAFSKEAKKALKLDGFTVDDWEIDLNKRYVWIRFSATKADVNLDTVDLKRKEDGIHAIYEKTFEGLDEATRKSLKKTTEIFDFYGKGKWIELYENCESCVLTFDDEDEEFQFLRLIVWCEDLDSAPDIRTVSKLFDEIVGKK